ncbi:MAG: tyrosine-type recombinase/integrase [Aestuariibacter sp.]|nr:tyrosine-type recombinase/integrase [Aestuariibacter sp.]
MQYLVINNDEKLTSADIERAALRSTVQWRATHGSRDARTPPETFVRVATAWLRFLDQLQEPADKTSPFASQVATFLAALLNERGLSPKTVHCYEWFVRQFCDWFSTQSKPFAAVCVEDVDAFLAHRGQRWCRVSVATAAKALRTFFRYAENQQWCHVGIAAAIESPRLFKHETLPMGPNWQVVQELIAQTDTDLMRDIRDRAILILLAIYGLRSSEVIHLGLDQLNWSQQRIVVRRPKQRVTQEYPLIPELGVALARYLKTVRPSAHCREVFVRLRAPVRPLSTGALYHLTRTRLAQLGYVGPHFGPHCLRHACAAHLVAQRLSLKEIGDHLGHRSPSATRTYAKVDLEGLREVARFDLGELL